VLIIYDENGEFIDAIIAGQGLQNYPSPKRRKLKGEKN